MIAHYVTQEQGCECCEATLRINEECVYTDDGYFCDEYCLKEFLFKGSHFKNIYLTDNEVYKE